MPVLELTDAQVVTLFQQLPEDQRQRVLAQLHHLRTETNVASGKYRCLLDCIHQQVKESGFTAAELDALFAQARKEAQQIEADSMKTPALGENHPLAKVAGSMSGETWREVMEELRQEREEIAA